LLSVILIFLLHGPAIRVRCGSKVSLPKVTNERVINDSPEFFQATCSSPTTSLSEIISMSRFLKLASALVVVCSLFSVAAPATVQAHDHFYPPVHHHHDCRQFDLYIGTCPHSLEYYGVYVSADAAQAVAREFNKQGYFVSIRPRF
jgi:hypothetical protein